MVGPVGRLSPRGKATVRVLEERPSLRHSVQIRTLSPRIVIGQVSPELVFLRFER
jgi:hypothetical protein